MLDRVPDDGDSMLAWFRYFRMTKHLPGMPMKFAAEMKRATTAPQAKMVLTAYAAASMDVVLFCGFRPNNELAQELQETFGIKPSQMLLLSIDDIAQPLKVTPGQLKQRLEEGGFAVSGDGVITAFTSPVPIQRAPRMKPPRF